MRPSRRAAMLRRALKAPASLAMGVSLFACRSSPIVRQLEAAHPGATFEVRLSRCTSTGESQRRFGSSLRTALLWSRERLRSARYFPCTATIDAVDGAKRRAIYRLAIERGGAYTEGVVAPVSSGGPPFGLRRTLEHTNVVRFLARQCSTSRPSAVSIHPSRRRRRMHRRGRPRRRSPVRYRGPDDGLASRPRPVAARAWPREVPYDGMPRA